MSLDAEFSSDTLAVEKKLLDQLFKRLFDVIIATSALVLLGPLFLMLAVAVLLFQGRPVIFRHRRLTVNAKSFDCLKFRSMVCNAEEKLQTHLMENPEAAREWEKNQKLRQDPRITPFGAFLRTSSLDELPQLINIIRGEMSLVGPRPIVEEELRRYGEHAETYLSVRPGLTGLWQINGRSHCAYQQRIELDLDYIQNWSFAGDLDIVAKTFLVVLSGRGSA
jgi:exopolysaccharide production protein ExoY